MLKGSLSLDLDNLWAYLKVKGDPHWKRLPSYFEAFIPEFLDFLDEHHLNITFFIVGQDAELAENGDLLKEVVKRGHEAANHSFHHEPGLKQKSFQEIEEEIGQAEEAIYRATGQRPAGFRGPGFCFSRNIESVLIKRGYVYDSSLFPSSVSPLARLYFSSISVARDSQQSLYGSFGDVLVSLRNHKKGALIEMPVTTIPYLRLPFHMTYLHYLASFSEPFMHAYLRTAIRLCSFSGIAPNFLLHPTDFMGSDQVPEMKDFPGMKIATSKKRKLCTQILTKLREHFELRTLHSVASEDSSKYSEKS